MPMTTPHHVDGTGSITGLFELGHSAPQSEIFRPDAVDFTLPVTESPHCTIERLRINGPTAVDLTLLRMTRGNDGRNVKSAALAHAGFCRAPSRVQPRSSPAADGGTRWLGAWYSVAYPASP